MSTFPIDAVVTWVDGGDPAHAAKMRPFLAGPATSDEDVAGTTRYASIGEIHWCVASLRKFAPFLRTIWLVTDGQDPHIAEGSIPVKIVDHKDIFDGDFSKALPIFNSTAIESLTWRIPGLAEHYIELNDDFLLCAPVSVDDFFLPDGTPVCYAGWHSIPLTRLTRAIKPVRHGHKKVTFKGMMLNGARRAGACWRYLKLDHTPRPLLRSFFEQWYSAHPAMLWENISFRFRDAAQFTSEEILYIRLQREGKLCLRPVGEVLFYMEPKHKKDYVPRKMAKLRAGAYKFCCFNSLDKADEAERKLVLDWIDALLA